MDEGEGYRQRHVNIHFSEINNSRNDNGPIFDHGHYEALLDKTALPGRKVAKVHAVDPDLAENGLLVYHFS